MSLDEELEEEVLYARAIYQHNDGVAARDVFFFADGAVVFWNMGESEQKAILRMLDGVILSVRLVVGISDGRQRIEKNNFCKNIIQTCCVCSQR